MAVVREDTLPFLGKLSKEGYFSEEIPIWQFFEETKADVQPHITSGRVVKPSAHMAQALNLPEAVIGELEDICSLDHLQCENEPDTELLLPPSKDQWSDVTRTNSWWERGVVDDIDDQACSKLLSLATQKERLLQLRKNRKDRSLFLRFLRYSNEIPLHRSELPHSRFYAMRGFNVSDCVIVVRVYHPANHPLSVNSNLPSTIFRISEEITCLGENSLTALRDLIKCDNDHVVVNDCSDLQAQPIEAKDVYPGAFFCINGTFYVDKRNTTTDYSEFLYFDGGNSSVLSSFTFSLCLSIRKWAHENRTACHLLPHDMYLTKMRHLTVKLGYPYMYQHQGDCCHVIVFSDLRLLNHTDDMKVQYPLVSAVSRHDGMMCQICDKYVAKWLTLDHELTPTRTLYFCQRCFKQLNYRNNSTKQFDFKAFPLLHPPCMQWVT